MDRLSAIAWHSGQASQGTASLALGHRRALAKMRATEVFPTPRAPLNKYAWETRSVTIAFLSVWTTWLCPTKSSNFRGRHRRAIAWYAIKKGRLGDPASHSSHCYRCFLPDLTG